MGNKLVMHYKGPKETLVRYNSYLVNDKLFWCLAYDVGKRTKNSSVCMPTVDSKMYYGKLTDIIEVEYYDRTKYVMFKCDWANTTRDREYKVDEYNLMLVNFKNLVHKRMLITNELYVLTSQVDQVFYVENERDLNWACTVMSETLFDN
jgi:hypothetical protein